MIELKEWIKDGINIDKIELSELTPERFKVEVQKQQKNMEMQNELFALAFGEV
jgi:hypothetical protein